MKWKALLEEAFQKGEQVKEDLLVEVVNSRLFNELLKNEKFIHAITAIIQTKDEIGKLIQNRVKQAFGFMDIPSRKDVDQMFAKVARLEHHLDRLTQKTRLAPCRKAAKKIKPVKKKKK